jgi:tetratricopeptide (TPR) repeat protein
MRRPDSSEPAEKAGNRDGPGTLRDDRFYKGESDMKAKSFSFFIHILIWGAFLPAGIQTVLAQRVRVESPSPQNKLVYGEAFRIEYDAASFFTGPLRDTPEITLLVYTNMLDLPKTTPMEKEDGVWIATITVRDTSVKMILFAFRAETPLDMRPKENLDTNDGYYWDALVCDQRGTVVEGAYQARAASYTGLGGTRVEDLDMALQAVETEMKLYPDNLSARSLYYSILLRDFEYSEEVRDRIDNDIHAQLRKRSEDTETLQFAIHSYQMIGMRDEAEELEDRLVRLNPRGEKAAQREFYSIMNIEEAQERMSALDRFLRNYPDTQSADFALSNLASTAIELNDTTRMIEVGDRILNESVSLAGASSLAGLAGALTEKLWALNRAISYAQRALELLQAQAYSMRPPDVPVQEWKQQILTTEARYRDILGWALIQQGSLDSGLSMLEEAEKGTSQPAVHYHLGLALEKTGQTDQALIQLARAVAHGGDVAELAWDEFYRIWDQLGRTEEDGEAFLDEQGAWLQEDFRGRILSLRNVRPAPDFELEARAGGWVRLADQRGSVILLCFWASWSQSSQMLFNDLEALAGMYGQDVLFLAIAADRDIRSTERFLQKNPTEITVLYNDGTDSDYGLQGVPTLFVIDARGNIHFEHRGYKPNIQAILSLELDDLLQ